MSDRQVDLDIDAIGAGRFDSPVDRAWLEWLRENPTRAKRLGAAMDRFHEKTIQAHPEEARRSCITIAQLRARGHHYAADQAELMGRAIL